MTLEELKELLSTYGVNEEERSALIFVSINGTPTPITEGEVDYTPWDEGNLPFVLLQAGDR